MDENRKKFVLDFALSVIEAEDVPESYYWSDGEILCPSCFELLYGDGEDITDKDRNDFYECGASDEEDTSILCDECGCELPHSLTEEGVESEIAHFTEYDGSVAYGHGSYSMALLVHDGILYYEKDEALRIGWIEARAWYAVE